MANTGKIPSNVGFTKVTGEIKRELRQPHTKADEGKQFTDSFGRQYTYTALGCIY